MADTDSQAVGMEEQMQIQSLDDPKNPCQQDSAYGSLESSSQGPSQKSSYSGSKSLNSGSSHSSGFGDNADFSSENRLKDTKHKDHKRKKTKEKAEKKVEKADKLMTKEEKKDKEMTRSAQNHHHDPRLISETASSIATGLEESSSAFNGHSNDGDERTDQPNLVYTQALNYIRKIKERSAEQGLPFASPELEQVPQDTPDISAFLKSFKSTRGFTVAISVQDGLVLQVSPAITDVLGFPKDMLIGQSFIDFVYPKDSINLSSKIIHGLNMPFRNDSIKDNYGTSFFCRMRMYHSLRSSGFGVRNKRTMYKPCKMILKFHDPSSLEETASTCGSSSSLLLAEVIPIQSIYQVPQESPALGSFSIRHTASCNFSEYDPEAIPYLGHLPQDLTGNSVFECYHPEDLPLLKKAYEEMVREQGKPHRSKPYRFRTFNGSYVTLETEWLCFVNPWTKRIDSIIGQHRVLKGPSDIAIFLDPGDKPPTPLPEEVMKEAMKAQKDIIELLAKPVVAYKDPSKYSQVIRRRTLANMMSSIVDELDNLEKSETQAITQHSLPAIHPRKAGRPQPPPRPDHCSPVQKGQESVTSSSESPSSYGHLNYSETIHRFFRSQPKTVSSDESGDSKMEVSHLGSLGSTTNKQSQSQDNSQSQSGSGSGDNCDHTRKSESTANGSGSGATACTSSQRRSYRHVQLTEEVLSRHNLDMQKMFMQRQRTEPKPHKNKAKLKTMKKPIKRPGERLCGVKRGGGALEHEGTASKQPFLAPSAAGSSGSIKPSSADVWGGQGESQTHIHSSGSAGATVGPGTTHVAAPSYPSIVPGFYFPTSTSSISQVAPVPRAPAPVPLVLPPQPPTFLHPQGVTAVPVQYIPGVMYQPVGPPLFNAPPLMLPNVVYQHTAVHAPLNPITVPMSDGEKPSGADSDHDLFEPVPQSAKSFIAKHSTSHLRRPDSRATSVKAEPGSARGSVRAEAESIGSPEKQDKMTMEPRHENSSDMVLSVTSSTGSPGEYKSSDDSMQNVSDNSENSEVSGMGMKWNIPRGKCQRPVLSDPPWLEDVKLTPELLYKYQLETKELVDVLRHDMEKLKSVRQPTMVDDQLSSLYNELELEGFSPSLHLEDGVTSSSDDQAGSSSQPSPRKKRSSSYFSKMAMLHEEDAPIPPFEAWCCHRQHAPETSSSSS